VYWFTLRRGRVVVNKKTYLSAIIISVFIVSLVAGLQVVEVAEANFLIPPNSLPTIYIRSDGSIEPSSAPVQQENKVYTLSSNLTGTTLEVQCDNIIVDGASYTLSSDNKSSPAILLRNRYNVTVKNFQVNSFCMMYIRVEGSTGCIITANTVVTYQGGAIVLNGCNNITITNNTIYDADTTIDGKGTSVYIGGDYHIVSGNQLFGGVT
jgi:parallel beta-helix repeat protein